MAGHLDVETWGAISQVIGRSEGAAKRYANRSREDPLPVYSQLGRVVASSADLRAWVARQVREPRSRQSTKPATS